MHLTWVIAAEAPLIGGGELSKPKCALSLSLSQKLCLAQNRRQHDEECTVQLSSEAEFVGAYSPGHLTTS